MRPGSVTMIFIFSCYLSFQSRTYAEQIIFEPETMTDSASPAKNAALDLLIPGYGMYKANEPFWAMGYAAAKIGTGIGIYFSVTTWIFWNSVATSAEKRQQMDSSLLLFQNPLHTSDYLSSQEMRNIADSRFLFIIYLSLLELVIYSISYWHTYSTLDTLKKLKGPFYKFSQNMSKTDTTYNLQLGYNTVF